jgi:uncharacterized damage-inducible protein DinB
MSIKDIAFADLPQELATTRRMIERIPTEHLGWKPHDKNFSLGFMASHVANLLEWGPMILTTDELDLAGPFPEREEPTSTEQILEAFDANAAKFAEALDAADDETMMETWTLKSGDEVLTAFPRFANLRSFVVNHVIHHRAHLGMYLRLLDVPVPAVYGPSADESPF